jgi:tetratricopeptide (TPR) repeat protein
MDESRDRRKFHPLVYALRRLLKVCGVHHRHLQEEWGLGKTAVLRRLHAGKGLDPFKIDRALARAGVPRERFYLGIGTGFHPELELDEIAARNRDQVWDFHKSVDEGRPRRVYDAGELREMADGLEELRFRDAEEARRRALEVLRSPDLDPDVAAKAWGVLGVVERYRGRAPVAASCFAAALRAGGCRRTRAQTLQRIAMLLLFDAGDPAQAWEAVLRARDAYSRCRDRSGLGKTLVDEGIVLFEGMSAYGDALTAFEAALELLGEKDFANRFGAVQGLAVAAVYLGDVPRAQAELERALALFEGEESRFRYASIVWLQGELALLLGRYLEAADLLLAVWDLYVDLDLGPVETAVVSLRMAKAYALRGDSMQVRRILREILLSFGGAERPSPLLGSTLGEFLREGIRGAVTAEALEEIYRKVRGTAETAPPLLPRTLPAS